MAERNKHAQRRSYNPTFTAELGPTHVSASDEEGNESLGWDLAGVALGAYAFHEMSDGNPWVTLLGGFVGGTGVQVARHLGQRRKMQLSTHEAQLELVRAYRQLKLNATS